jgi:hypothetical protein
MLTGMERRRSRRARARWQRVRVRTRRLPPRASLSDGGAAGRPRALGPRRLAYTAARGPKLLSSCARLWSLRRLPLPQRVEAATPGDPLPAGAPAGDSTPGDPPAAPARRLHARRPECAPGGHYGRRRSASVRRCVMGRAEWPLNGCSGHRTHVAAVPSIPAGRSGHRAHIPPGHRAHGPGLAYRAPSTARAPPTWPRARPRTGPGLRPWRPRRSAPPPGRRRSGAAGRGDPGR